MPQPLGGKALFSFKEVCDMLENQQGPRFARRIARARDRALRAQEHAEQRYPGLFRIKRIRNRVIIEKTPRAQGPK